MTANATDGRGATCATGSTASTPAVPATLTIGALARRTGLTVRTIRFYADAGVVPESTRSDAGYRLFDEEAVARLRLVRTLRELGVGLDEIRAVLARESSVAEVAAAHATAIDAQIKTLRLRRAVLSAIAAHTDPKELDAMHDLATLDSDERRRLVDDYLDAVFGDVDDDGTVLAKYQMGQPRLPDDPTPAQLEAWVELAQLLRDPGFRRASRTMAERGAAESKQPSASPMLARAVAEHAGAARRDGIDPASDAARPVVELIEATVPASANGSDGRIDRAALAERIEAFTDRRVARYWQLVAIVNGWPPQPDVLPAWEWFAAALRAHA
jgi:DNA-binding transcriptional MerR regulator